MKAEQFATEEHMPELHRCPWAETPDVLMQAYHDTEWGVPCHDESRLFEMLILEGAQAGLSWSCVLHKRENYRAAFDSFNVQKVAAYDGEKIAALLQNPGIIRNKLKIAAAVTNAQCALKLPGGLGNFLWNYAGGVPVVGGWARQEDMPVNTPLSDRISRDMKKLGFKFVGSTIIYSYLQAVGIVNDHIHCCAFKATSEKLDKTALWR
ncbi:MAG: DNA-3-methyladenine glycosylase I [Oscillospiraceae bacterium]|jgi:DNA-3-methyladenine glycosylase I|nr:DNA-3-methyladenine glycosylase I [Oscillospiraceae bacterium]